MMFEAAVQLIGQQEDTDLSIYSFKRLYMFTALCVFTAHREAAAQIQPGVKVQEANWKVLV